MLRAIAIAALLLATALAACGEEDGGNGRGGGQSESRGPASGPGRSASTDQVERQIRQRLLRPNRVDGQVRCPPRIKVRRGNNFKCEVTGEREGTVEVTQKDDEGNLNYRLTFD